MVICQHCKDAVDYSASTCVFITPSTQTYLCLVCSYTEDFWDYRDLPPIRVCKDCGSVNEFYAHCFTCLNDKIFWSMKKKVGI